MVDSLGMGDNRRTWKNDGHCDETYWCDFGTDTTTTQCQSCILRLLMNQLKQLINI